MKAWVFIQYDKCEEVGKLIAVFFDEEHALAFEDHADAFTEMAELTKLDDVEFKYGDMVYTKDGIATAIANYNRWHNRM